MSDPNWDEWITANVPAKPGHGYWTMVLDYVDASERLNFVAEDERDVPPAEGHPAEREDNKWTYADRKACYADGDPKAPINPANCLIPDAPPGALIGKIGGSTAGKSDGAKMFVVGSFCVLELDANTKGTLYLTMNADPMSSLKRDGHLKVKIQHSK